MPSEDEAFVSILTVIQGESRALIEIFLFYLNELVIDCLSEWF
jgi:hypothetical protein